MQGQEKRKFVVLITRTCCENADISMPLKILQELIKTPFAMRSTVHITFDGYDDDPREVQEIPEIVAYYKKLNEAFPQLLLFIDYSHGPDLPTYNFVMHLMLLLQGQYTSKRHDDTGIIVSDISGPQISKLIVDTWPHIEKLFPPTLEGNMQYNVVDKEISNVIRQYIS